MNAVCAHMKPQEISMVLSDNLKRLIGGGNVSQIARDIGINRTQFYRYIRGESHPRPDVLARICAYFEVDGNVVLAPLPEQSGNSEFDPAPVPDGRVFTVGNTYLADAKGALVPIELIKPEDLLEDKTVRKIIGYALALSDQVARFKAHVFDDLGAFEAVLEETYGATRGGTKGNKTFLSHDGLYKAQVAVAEHIDFGPQLQIAKGLVDECLTDWSADARPELRAIVTRAFNTDKAGQINRADIFMLLRLDIDDVRWISAMDAIRAAMRVVGSKTYVRCYHRPEPDAPWAAITIDLAKA